MSCSVLYRGVYNRVPGDSINEVILNTENPQYCPGNVRESIRFVNFKFDYPFCAKNYNVDLVSTYDRLLNCNATDQPQNDLLSATQAYIVTDSTGSTVGNLFANAIFYDTGSGTLPADSIQTFYTATASGILKNVKKIQIEFQNNPAIRIATFYS